MHKNTTVAGAGAWCIWRRSWVMLTVAVCASAAMADLFFYGHPVGWTAGAALLVLTGFILLRSFHLNSGLRVRLLAIICATLAVPLIGQPTRLNIACALSALGTLAIVMRSDAPQNFVAWVTRWVGLLMGPLVRPLVDGKIAGRWLRRHPRSLTLPLRTIGLWTVPAILGSMFLALFAVANPIVENWLHWLADQFDLVITEIENLLEPDRVALWLCAAAVTYALLRASRKRTARPTSFRQEYSPPAMQDVLAVIPEESIVIRCLSLFNLLFAVETGLDLMYLWGGRMLPNGLNHVQYAHRGAYPLIATALLAGAFVLITFRQHARTSQLRIARALVYLWIAQNVVLTLSAAWRLWLLVDTSLLTRWRLATSIWLLLVAAGLVSLIWRILRKRDNAWLLRHNFITGAATLYVCCFLNLDGFIASWNAVHCNSLLHGATAESVAYFRILGEESLPALQRLGRTIDTAEGRDAAAQISADLTAALRDELHDWRGWTWQRARLLHELDAAAAQQPGQSHVPLVWIPRPEHGRTFAAGNADVLVGSEKQNADGDVGVPRARRPRRSQTGS